MATREHASGPATRAFPVAVVAVIAAATLAFGAVYDWGYWSLAATATVVGACGAWIGRGEPWAERRVALGLTLIAAATLVQMVPLPAAAVDRINPGAREFLLRYDMRYAAEAMLGGGPSLIDAPRTLSIQPDRTAIALALLVALSIWALGLARGFTRTGVLGVVQGLLVFGVALAVFAVIQDAVTPRTNLFEAKVYGFWKPRGHGAIFGPFINRNHYAGWMLLVIPLGLGYVATLAERGLADVRPAWRDRVLWLGSPRAGQLLLAAFGVVVMAVSLVISGSRSGLGGLAVSLVLGSTFAMRAQRSRRRQLAAAGVFGLVAVAILAWGGLDIALSRLQTVSTEIGGRIGIWRDTLRIIGDFPWTGTGMNTFGFASLIYQSATPLSEHYKEAHNEYLQVAAEGGLLVGVPILLCLWWLGRLIVNRLDDGNRVRYWMRAGAVTSLLAIAAQSLVEFSLQMPANAALAGVVIAIAMHRGSPAVDLAEVVERRPDDMWHGARRARRHR